MDYTDEVLQAMAIQLIRNYKNFPFEITDDEIVDKYGLAIDRIKNNIIELQDCGNQSGAISSITNGDETISYTNKGSFIDCISEILLGKPYIRIY